MQKDYYEVTNIKEKQKILLFLFKNIHDICEKNKLVYNAFGGTMLGAVRHKGFIPWDDDIDITMPRKDYYKFINIVREQYKDLFVLHSYPDKNYIYPYAKFGLVGSIQIEKAVRSPYNKLTINIDIFPVDGYPPSEHEIDVYNGYEENIILCTYQHKLVKFIAHPKILIKCFISKLHGYKYYVNKQIGLFSKNDIDSSEYVLCQGAGWGSKGKLKKNIYFDRALYEFEDIKVWGIKDYDAHLRMLYGDYLSLPPKEKQVSPHDNTVLLRKDYAKMLL